MAVLTADRTLVDKEGLELSVPVANNVKIYKGSLVCYDTLGYANVGADTSGFTFAGYALETVDNTVAGHTAGGVSIRVQTGRRVTLPGTGFTQASVGAAVYVADSGAVSLTATNYVFVGIVVYYNSTTSVDVEVPRGGASAPLTSISGLTSTAAELNQVHSVVPGTSGASKILVLGASKNTDVLKIDTTLNLATGVAITGAGTFSMTGIGASSITITSGNLTLATATSGSLILTSAGVLTGTAVGNSSITVTSGSFTLATATSGALTLTSAGAITVTSATASTWAATGGLTFSAGLINLGAAASVAYSATMALVVASNVITIAASNGTSAAFTVNCAAAAPAGATLIIVTTADGTGTVTGTFGTNFKVTATQVTTLSHFSTIMFVGDGTRWIEIARNTNQA